MSAHHRLAGIEERRIGAERRGVAQHRPFVRLGRADGVAVDLILGQACVVSEVGEAGLREGDELEDAHIATRPLDRIAIKERRAVHVGVVVADGDRDPPRARRHDLDDVAVNLDQQMRAAAGFDVAA